MAIARVANVNVNIRKRSIFLFSDQEMSVCKKEFKVNNTFVINNLTQQWGMWFRIKCDNCNKNIDQISVGDLLNTANSARFKYGWFFFP
jgi:hypothetical protein